MLKFEEAKSWLKEAGRLSMGYFGRAKPSIKDNQSYVTEADLLIQKLLKEKI